MIRYSPSNIYERNLELSYKIIKIPIDKCLHVCYKIYKRRFKGEINEGDQEDSSVIVAHLQLVS